MKRGILSVLVLAIVMVAEARAQDTSANSNGSKPFSHVRIYQTFDIQRHEDNFLKSLEHTDTLVVESALAQVAMLKLAQPRSESRRMRTKVEDLVFHGRTTCIRYRAYLVSAVFNQPEMFAQELYRQYDTSGAFFTALAQRLQNATLAVN